MIPNVKIVKLSDREVKCYDLTYGYMVGVESGSITETMLGVVEDGTDLSEDEVLSLRRSEVQEVYNTILQLTYPNLYNEDGTLKEIDSGEQSQEEDKKKA